MDLLPLFPEKERVDKFLTVSAVFDEWMGEDNEKEDPAVLDEWIEEEVDRVVLDEWMGEEGEEEDRTVYALAQSVVYTLEDNVFFPRVLLGVTGLGTNSGEPKDPKYPGELTDLLLLVRALGFKSSMD